MRAFADTGSVNAQEAYDVRLESWQHVPNLFGPEKRVYDVQLMSHSLDPTIKHGQLVEGTVLPPPSASQWAISAPKPCTRGRWHTFFAAKPSPTTTELSNGIETI